MPPAHLCLWDNLLGINKSFNVALLIICLNTVNWSLILTTSLSLVLSILSPAILSFFLLSFLSLKPLTPVAVLLLTIFSCISSKLDSNIDIFELTTLL